jgi:beta-RFAP synthase
LVIEASGPEHAGLGTGTQLGLAVAAALAEVAGLGKLPAAELARRVGRGARSALGVHGFDHGGFLVEAGKVRSDAIAPLVARLDFPDDWRVVLMLPGDAQGLHGEGEVQAFLRLGGGPSACDALCRLVLLGMLPALAEGDLPAFGEGLYEFNRQVGEMFRPVQGGAYAHPRTEEAVALLCRLGVHGAGQSSWGPAVFGVAGDEGQAQSAAARLRARFGLAPDEVLVTRAGNQGAAITKE